MLIFFAKVFSKLPWPPVILAFAAIAWFASRKWALLVGVAVTLVLIGMLGLWVDTMKTVSLRRILAAL